MRNENPRKGKELKNKSGRVTIRGFDKFIKNKGFVVSEHDTTGSTFVFGPEKRVVRRTSRDFKAGAEPSTGESYRFKNVGVSMTPELHEFAKIIAEQHDMPFKAYARAALRYAMRHGMNPHEELESELKISLPPEHPKPEVDN